MMGDVLNPSVSYIITETRTNSESANIKSVLFILTTLHCYQYILPVSLYQVICQKMLRPAKSNNIRHIASMFCVKCPVTKYRAANAITKITSPYITLFFVTVISYSLWFSIHRSIYQLIHWSGFHKKYILDLSVKPDHIHRLQGILHPAS